MHADSGVGVLVVGDRRSSAPVIATELEQFGYCVFGAQDAMQAMRVLLTEGPPIVITELDIPEVDGLELCRTIRAHEAIRYAFVIAVAEKQAENDPLINAFEAGADDFVNKPVDMRELAARVRAAERNYRLQQELDERNRHAYRCNAQVEIINAKLAQANAELNRMATTDELTGLLNRREALDRLDQCWKDAKSKNTPLSILAMDIDRFKGCNDAFGHAVGDLVLRETSRMIQVHAHADACACRMGGEEFLILCPHQTEEQAAQRAEKLRIDIEHNRINSGDVSLAITMSIGVAQRTDTMSGPDDLLRTADGALYAAKDAGRNIVHCASVPCKMIGCSSSASIDTGSPPSGSACQGNFVLVGADECERAICRALLQRSGYQVIEAVDGAEALHKAEACSPDVIVLDAKIPNMDGLECTRRLKQNPATNSIPVIMAGSRSDSVDVVSSLEAGADEFLCKPVSPKELILRVKTMARLSRELIRSNEVRGEQSRALGLLMEFTTDITSAHGLEDVVERTVHAAAALTCSSQVAVLLPDAQRHVLYVSASLGIDQEDFERLAVPFSDGTTGAVYDSGESALFNTVDAPRGPREKIDGVLFAHSPAAAIALQAQNATVGVLTLSGKRNHEPFAAVELEYVRLLGNIAASAIHERVTRNDRDEARHAIVIALARLAEHRDSETGRHVDRVTQFSILLAKTLRQRKDYRDVITDAYLQDLQRSVPLHDIGKVSIPDYILHKPETLTPQETQIMQSHAEVGARTLRSVVERMPDTSFLTMAEEIAHAHHEWYNGKGYPCGLRGPDIPLAARLTTLADVYDALTTRRCYKPAMNHDQARTIIEQGAGTQFDPDVVHAFLECEEDFRELATDLADTVAQKYFPSQADIDLSDSVLCSAPSS